MAEEEQDQKTEAPTGKRLEEARGQGQVPISREASTWVLFVGVLIAVAFFVPEMSRQMVLALRVFIEMPHAISLDDNGLQRVFFDVLLQIGMATIGVFAILLTAAVLGTMLQTGFFFSFETIRPKFERLNPLAGLQRFISPSSLIELGKSVAKLVVLGGMSYLVLVPVVKVLPSLSGRTLMDLIAFLHQQAIHLIIMLMVVFTGIAIVDLLYQRFHYIKSLRMTKAEVKDEFRQQEGDPAIKSRLRAIRVERARKRMMAQVPKADVVVTNPTHYAIALQYDKDKMDAPTVLAKGINRIAERIRDVALEHDIPLVSNPPLARALYDTVELDQEIPTQHYRAVAEVISYVYKLKKRKY